MPRLVIALLLLVPAVVSADRRARNVVLFLADAGGIPTIHAASLHGYGAPRKLFIQRMPHIGLSETSSASRFVTDSAAGMTAIVTGQKTNNNVVSQSASAERGVRDGEPLKSILEHAEERGLSTGIITNDALTGATPAALYAKANDRVADGRDLPAGVRAAVRRRRRRDDRRRQAGDRAKRWPRPGPISRRSRAKRSGRCC